MNFDCGIYAITSPSGRQYIGQAKSFKIRWSAHQYLLRLGKHHCKPLQAAYDKYGEDGLKYSKIALVPEDQLSAREQEQIDARPMGMLYNTSIFVDAPMRGVKRPPSVGLAVAAAHRGTKHTDEHRAKISASLKGRSRPKEVREKIAASKKNMSPDYRKKLSLSASRRTHTAETRRTLSEYWTGKRKGADSPSARPVICMDTGHHFASMSMAAEWLVSTGRTKANTGLISSACTGTRKTAYGFHWAYAEQVHCVTNELTAPVMPLIPCAAPCAAEPIAVAALDHRLVPAKPDGIIC
jgi:group I intron endonuclease